MAKDKNKQDGVAKRSDPGKEAPAPKTDGKKQELPGGTVRTDY